MATKRGQALVELAFGMFAVALVASMVFLFTRIIAAGLDNMRPLRAQAGRQALNSIAPAGVYSTVGHVSEVNVQEPLAVTYITGADSVKIESKVRMPSMAIDPTGETGAP